MTYSVIYILIAIIVLQANHMNLFHSTYSSYDNENGADVDADANDVELICFRCLLKHSGGYVIICRWRKEMIAETPMNYQ